MRTKTTRSDWATDSGDVGTNIDLPSYLAVVRRAFATDEPWHYLGLLDRIHKHLLPRTYLEVGVSRGASFDLAQPGTARVGVDPDPKLALPSDPAATVFATTSDDFFDQYSVSRPFNGHAVDMAFIDGMHLFEFALRDFMHIESLCHRGSVVLLHDCYPMDESTSRREPTSGAWSGDIWKVILCLKEQRPDLHIATVDAPPTGLGIITGIDPRSTVLRERYDDMVARFVGLEYAVLQNGKKEMLNRVPDDWPTVRALLPPPFRTDEIARAIGRRIELDRSCRALRRRVGRSSAGPVLRSVKRRVAGVPHTTEGAVQVQVRGD